MAQQRKSGAGCFIIAAILGVVVIGACAIFVLFLGKVRMTESHEAAIMSELHDSAESRSATGDARDQIVFTEANRPKMSVPRPGEEVTREQFAAYMIDDAATELARESFRKVTDQAEIRWNLRLKQIADRNGKLHGEFELPWMIRHGHGSSSSSFNINVWFDEAGRDALLKLRRGDWVTVEGRLSYVKGNHAIEGALIGDAEVAEKP